MRFLDFLKHFSNKEVKVKEFTLQEINEQITFWSKKTLSITTTNLEELNKKLEEEKSKVLENTKKLLKTELKNPNIPERAKHIMEGNRKMYIQRIERFLETISLPEDFKKLLEFCNYFNDSLNKFAKETTKSYQVLNEFFISETREVANNIKNIDNLIKKSKRLVEESKILETELLKNKLKKVNQGENLKEKLRKNIKQKKDLISNKILSVKKEESNLQDLEEGKNYKYFITLTDKKKSIIINQKNLETEFLQKFSIIIPALKKYERLTLQKEIVRKYLNNSLQSLLSDQELKITEILNKMKDLILNQEIELKDKKKDKILEELKNLDKSYFKNFIENYKNFTTKKNNINQELRDLTITEKIEKQRKFLKEEQEKLNIENNNLDELINELKNISITQLKENLTKEIKHVMNQKVKII